MQIQDFYRYNTVDKDFDETFYASVYPETADFYQPYCANLKISNKERLFFHWNEYGQKLGMLKNREYLNTKYKFFENPKKYEIDDRLCLIVHVYYLDVWEQEIVEPIKNISTNYDLYVTIPKNSDDHRISVLKHFPEACILEVENRGSDIGPFIHTVKYLESQNVSYKYGIKLHTKKSTHLEQTYAQRYRTHFYNNLCYNASYCLKLMECDSSLGMIAPENTLLSLTKEEDINNIGLVSYLLHKAKIKDDNKIEFVAGTMFAYRCDLLHDDICNLDINIDDFQLGHNPDGTLAHAFERFFGSLIRHKNKSIYTLGELPKDFDHREYALLNPDLNKAYGDDKYSLEQHYLIFGQIEKRRHKTIYPFNKLENIAKNSNIHTTKNKQGCVVLVNHDFGLHGASLALQHLANYLQDKKIFSKIIFIDTVPNDLHVLSNKIEIAYHLNDKNALLDILDSLSVNLIIANSLNILALNYNHFKEYLHKTIFHFHECVEDIKQAFGDNYKDDLLKLIQLAKSTFFVAPKILEELSSEIEIKKHKLNHKISISTEILYGNHLEKFMTAQKPTRKNKRVKICMCGSICDRKNPKLFVELSDRNPQYDFIWVGGDLSKFIKTKIPNLTSILSTQNPEKYFLDIDYFLLTSTRDPCPYVVLENLVLNNKIILLEGNIKYEHPVRKLENVHIISDHKNSADIITRKLKPLNLDTQKNKTNKNREYVLENFTDINVYHKRPINKKHIVLSYYSNQKSDLSFYTNTINQRILFDNDVSNVYIALSGDNPDNLTHEEKFLKENIHTDNLYINKRPNIGWDIGGLVNILSHYDIPLDEYIMYIHNKSNPIWREELFKIVYHTDKDINYDSIVCGDNLIKCSKQDKNREIFLKHDFMKHLFQENFNFISGTCFTTKMIHLKPLVDNINEISSNLTDINKDDEYWRQQMFDYENFYSCVKRNSNNIYAPKIDEDSRQTMIDTDSKNYFELLFKHGKRGIADCMFEHALERYIGYLISKNKKVLTV